MTEKMKNQPATMGVVAELRSEMISRFHGVDEKFTSIDTRINQLETKMDSRFHELKTLIMEQNSKIDFVLDGLSFLNKRQDRLEARLDKIKS